ncbi:uncharacterized protein LOC136090781 [Hydra vulgaris]|uniref:Uncharacterized protein LOC136090781 n=1 Tax=Hydra vulgaris TaxID=6087 RepID=A0ABM4DH09_HYDVU
MGKQKDISPSLIGLIQGFILAGNSSNRQKAKNVKVSRATVDRIKKKMGKNEPLLSEKRKNCGRHRVTTPRTERKIRDIVEENRRKSKKVLKEILKEQGISISLGTLRRRLAEQGFKACRPAIRPKLTEAMKENAYNGQKIIYTLLLMIRNRFASQTNPL